MNAVATRLKKFGRCQDGQVALVVILLVLGLLAFVLSIPNVTYVTTQKMRAQTAADAGAFTASIWLARALNLITVLNIGIRWMYVWMVVLTAVLAIAAALQVVATFFPVVLSIVSGICFVFFGVGTLPQAASRYQLAIRNLRESARWLAGLQDDIAETFPWIAIAMGSYVASENMGHPSLERMGIALSMPDPTKIELEPAGSALEDFLNTITGPLGGGFGVGGLSGGSVGGSVGFDEDFNPDAEYTFQYDAEVKVIQEWRKLVGRRITHTYRRGRDERIGPVTRYYTVPEADIYVPLGTAYFPDFERLKTEVPPWTCQGSQTPVYDEQPAESDWINWERWSAEEKEQFLQDYHTPPYEPLLPEAQGLIDNGYELISSRVERKKAERSGGAEPEQKERSPAVPRKVKDDYHPYTLAFAWRFHASADPLGLRPVLGKSLFPKDKAGSPIPLLSVAQAQPYMDPSVNDPVFTPEWDSKMCPVDMSGATRIADEGEFRTVNSKAQGKFDLGRLLGYVLLH